MGFNQHNGHLASLTNYVTRYFETPNEKLSRGLLMTKFLSDKVVLEPGLLRFNAGFAGYNFLFTNLFHTNTDPKQHTHADTRVRQHTKKPAAIPEKPEKPETEESSSRKSEMDEANFSVPSVFFISNRPHTSCLPSSYPSSPLPDNGVEERDDVVKKGDPSERAEPTPKRCKRHLPAGVADGPPAKSVAVTAPFAEMSGSELQATSIAGVGADGAAGLPLVHDAVASVRQLPRGTHAFSNGQLNDPTWPKVAFLRLAMKKAVRSTPTCKASRMSEEEVVTAFVNQITPAMCDDNPRPRAPKELHDLPADMTAEMDKHRQTVFNQPHERSDHVCATRQQTIVVRTQTNVHYWYRTTYPSVTPWLRFCTKVPVG